MGTLVVIRARLPSPLDCTLQEQVLASLQNRLMRCYKSACWETLACAMRKGKRSKTL